MNADEAAHLRRAKDLVDRSCAEPLDVAALARHAFVSPAHFSRRFKEAYGETPYQYVLSRRVERAQELLRNTELPVTEIGLEVGFQSLGSFSSAFHRIARMTPTAYRAAMAGLAPHVPGCWAAQWTRPSTAGMEKRADTGRNQPTSRCSSSVLARRSSAPRRGTGSTPWSPRASPAPSSSRSTAAARRSTTSSPRASTVIREPMERFYGIDAAFRDDSGNHIRLTERAETGIAPPA